MKTLDEVLKSYELSCGKKDCSQCPYDDECSDHFTCECYERMNDTLHYLKEYRDYRNSDKTVIENDSVSDAENEPLTWEELCKMEGKPVWVEDNLDVPEDITKYWAVVKKFEKAECFEYVVLDDLCYGEREHGKVWQAYRKER